MLSGDNSILQKATDAKTNTERANVIELAKTDILGQIVENKGETITETQLKTILGKYFEEFDDELPEDLSETTITLTAKEEYGGYTNIALADIYNREISKIVTHTYHINYETDGYYGTHVYLLDESENIIPILETYPVSFNQLCAFSWDSWRKRNDGSAYMILQTSMFGPGFVTVTITYNGQDVTGDVYIYPQG